MMILPLPPHAWQVRVSHLPGFVSTVIRPWPWQFWHGLTFCFGISRAPSHHTRRT